MRKAAVAGIAALSITGGSLVIAAVVPVAAALAQDSGVTTTAPGATPTAPGATPASKAGRPAAGHPRFGQAAAKARDGMADKRDAVRAKFGVKAGEIATFLGISADDLKTQLKTKSLGEIAGDKKPALITLLTDAINARVDEAVASGKISQAKADKVKAETAARVTKLVDVVGRKDLAGKPGGMRPKRGR